MGSPAALTVFSEPFDIEREAQFEIGQRFHFGLLNASVDE